MNNQPPSGRSLVKDLGNVTPGLLHAVLGSDPDALHTAVRGASGSLYSDCARALDHQTPVLQDFLPGLPNLLASDKPSIAWLNADDLFIIRPDTHQGIDVSTRQRFMKSLFGLHDGREQGVRSFSGRAHESWSLVQACTACHSKGI